MTEGHRTHERPRPRTRAAAHFARTGCILPGHAGEVAAYLKERREAEVEYGN